MTKRATGIVEQVLQTAGEAGLSDRELLRRFADTNDQSAFAALVRRHTGMVLGVCRRALSNPQDAEDACQATFLVLAQKAKSSRWQPSVANWLYTTARKVAHNARVAAQRRAKREGRAAVPEAVEPVDTMTARELLAALDEELDKLPPRYREPLVLCYLEGLTRDEAARRLGVPAATLKAQLERGRKRLAESLTRRGCVLGAGLLALAATSPAGASPPRLVEAVLAAVAGSPPITVALLAKGVAVNGLVNNSLLVLVLVAGMATLGIGMGSMAVTAGGPQAAQAAAKPEMLTPQQTTKSPATTAATPPAADAKDSIAYAGRVLASDGRPIPGAKLHMTLAWGYPHHPSPSPEYATTGPDGRFKFTVPKAEFGDYTTVVAAAAANHGIGWVKVPAEGKRDDLTLRLVDDDGPITGQIVDLEGKPVPNATLTVMQINAAPGKTSVRGSKQPRAKRVERRYRTAVPLAVHHCCASPGHNGCRGPHPPDRHRTQPPGRAQLDGPTIASQYLQILTRPGDAITVTEREGHPEDGDPRTVTTYYGANFKHATAPTKPIVGVVRDKDTKKPLAGITIQSYARAIGPGRFRAWTSSGPRPTPKDATG